MSHDPLPEMPEDGEDDTGERWVNTALFWLFLALLVVSATFFFGGGA